MTDPESAKADAVPEAPEMAVAPEPAVLELEFRMAPEEIPLLAHLPILAALRKGRISSVAEEIRWLDTPGGAVMGSGKLIEVPRRGPKRLVTLQPAADAPWHPGMVLPSAALPSPYLEQADGGVEALIPLAAFSGRRRRQTLVLGDAIVQLRVLHGHLRTVMAERETARVSLLGPPAAVLDLAQRLAAACPLLPSSLSLAAEALSLATGQPPAPRRRGAPRPRNGKLAAAERAALAARSLDPTDADGGTHVQPRRRATRLHAGNMQSTHRPGISSTVWDPLCEAHGEKWRPRSELKWPGTWYPWGMGGGSPRSRRETAHRRHCR